MLVTIGFNTVGLWNKHVFICEAMKHGFMVKNVGVS